VLLAWYEETDCKTIGAIKLKWIQDLSSASYAIFLIHFSVSLLVSAVVFNFWSENIPMNALGLLISFLLSVVLGRQLHLHIEMQEATWKRWLKWVATFVATCTGVMLLG
jgi:peptidoglycan/LPS O-acetylase OafA/YrhL